MHFSRKLLASFRLATAAIIILASTVGNAISDAPTAEGPDSDGTHAGLTRELSNLTVTIEDSAPEIANLLNRVVGKDLYKGSTKTRGLTADVLRNGPIAVSASDNYINFTVPATVSLSYGMFETPPFATRLKFKVRPTVTPDWKIIAEVCYTGVSDALPENAGIGPLSVKPRSILEGITQTLQRNLSDLATKKLNEKFPLKSHVSKAWNAAQKPIPLNKNYGAWLNLVPHDVMFYPFYAQGNKVRLTIGLTSFADLVVGPEPATPRPRPLPSLKLVNTPDTTFRVAISTDVFFKDLLNIAAPLLLDKKLGSNGKSVVMKELDIYGNGDRLMVKTMLTGDIDGTFLLSCKPLFDPKTSIFSVDDVDFDMQTRDYLLKTADWLLHGTIRRTIQEKLNMDLTGRLTQAREIAGKAMARVKLADNLYFSGNIHSIRLRGVAVQKDRISIQVYSEGEAGITFH